MDHKNILSFYLKQLQIQIMINCIQGDQKKKLAKIIKELAPTRIYNFKIWNAENKLLKG